MKFTQQCVIENTIAKASALRQLGPAAVGGVVRVFFDGFLGNRQKNIGGF